MQPDTAAVRRGEELNTATLSEYLGEPVTVKVKPGTQSGTTVRVKGRGVPAADARHEPGDLLVTFDVVVPDHLTDEQRAALEALACGVPVVASRVGGLPEVIEHGVSGYLHAPDDLDGMAQSIVTMLGDRMEMAHSIEGRVPFLDHHLVEVIRSQPVSRGPWRS